MAMLDAFKTCGSSPPKQTGRLQKFECIFTHRAGFIRHISVYAIDDATAERIAWYALVGARGWRHTWTVKSVAAEAR